MIPWQIYADYLEDRGYDTRLFRHVEPKEEFDEFPTNRYMDDDWCEDNLNVGLRLDGCGWGNGHHRNYRTDGDGWGDGSDGFGDGAGESILDRDADGY